MVSGCFYGVSVGDFAGLICFGLISSGFGFGFLVLVVDSGLVFWVDSVLFGFGIRQNFCRFWVCGLLFE